MQVSRDDILYVCMGLSGPVVIGLHIRRATPCSPGGCDSGWITGALLSKAAGKPRTPVARGGKRLELSKGCLCICVWARERNSNYAVMKENCTLACSFCAVMQDIDWRSIWGYGLHEHVKFLTWARPRSSSVTHSYAHKTQHKQALFRIGGFFVVQILLSFSHKLCSGWLLQASVWWVTFPDVPILTLQANHCVCLCVCVSDGVTGVCVQFNVFCNYLVQEWGLSV